MSEFFQQIPSMDLVLGIAVLISGSIGVVLGRRGGHFRGLPGWAGFWLGFATLLIALALAPRWASFILLAGLMFAQIRVYFFVAPVRPSDRWAILAAYIAIPLVLYPAYLGKAGMFMAAVPVLLFLSIPVLVAIGPRSEGLLDSMGRTLLGTWFFVFCTAHLGLLAHKPDGQIELYGVLVLAAELPRRLIGPVRPGWPRYRVVLGVVASMLMAGAAGLWLGESCGLVEEDAARAGLLVALTVAGAGIVSHAVARDLEVKGASGYVGRPAFLDRAMTAVYAAPVYYHYLDYFA